jgi:hypothetical protein
VHIPFLGSGYPKCDKGEEQKARLVQHLHQEGQKFLYEYDFGDSWEHEIVVEKILPVAADTHYPRCLKGKRVCPPEDCGGVWGYAELLEALADEAHPDRALYLEMVGDAFDPEEFDLDWVNEVLVQM